MTAPHPALLERFRNDQFQPATFLERGVSVPFTTPVLMGSRIRPAPAEAFLEIVIPNPSGGRGFYVVPWLAMPEICSPTLHDRWIWQRLQEQPAVSPSVVREIGREAALQGLAGRGAARAAEKHGAEERGLRLRSNYLLLLALIRRTENSDEANTPPETDLPSALEHRARRALARAARRLETSAEQVAGGLETLAGVFGSIGMADDPNPSRLRRLLRDLAGLAEELHCLLRTAAEGTVPSGYLLILEAARLTLACADVAMADIDALLRDPLKLLAAWRENAQEMARRATRPDWLLDGWEVLCAMWRDSPTGLHEAASWEMAMLAPVMPREVEHWFGLREDWDRPTRLRRNVRALEEWRTGRTLDLMARNERLRALA